MSPSSKEYSHHELRPSSDLWRRTRPCPTQTSSATLERSGIPWNHYARLDSCVVCEMLCHPHSTSNLERTLIHRVVPIDVVRNPITCNPVGYKFHRPAENLWGADLTERSVHLRVSMRIPMQEYLQASLPSSWLANAFNGEPQARKLLAVHNVASIED